MLGEAALVMAKAEACSALRAHIEKVAWGYLKALRKEKKAIQPKKDVEGATYNGLNQ